MLIPKVSLALAIAAQACASLATAQEGWATYTIPRFGTTADYPDHLFTQRDPPPENGDGQTFRTENGLGHLLIYVVSGTRSGEIFYERCNFSPTAGGVMDCLNLVYPAQDTTAWDPIVKRLGESLRASRGVESR